MFVATLHINISATDGWCDDRGYYVMAIAVEYIAVGYVVGYAVARWSLAVYSSRGGIIVASICHVAGLFDLIRR